MEPELIISLDVAIEQQTIQEAQLYALLRDMVVFISSQGEKIKHLGPLHTLIQNQIHHLKLKMLTGRGSAHIWIKQESNLGKNWATIIIE